ncbi:MAG: hypothetical protein K6A33_10650 [Clostridiales bacterium]|nr:hypothetical protein [Clostridiales bacterium]
MRLFKRRLRLKLRTLVDNRTALTILLFGLILLALLLTFAVDMFGVRTAIYRMIYGRGEDSNSPGGDFGGIPSMTHPIEEDGESIYFSYSDESILDELIPKERYTRAIRIIRQWEGESSMDRYILTVDGSCWEVSGSALTAFCDGEHAYLLSDAYAMVTDPCSFEPLIGITSLDEITKAAAQGGAEISVTDQNVRVVLSDADSGVRDQYEISIESGIVVSEQSSYNGELYRFVTTEILTDPVSDLNDRLGDLRDAFYASRPDLAPAGQNDQDGGTP